MSSRCRRKLNDVRRQVAVDIGCSCTPKLFTSLFSSSSHSRAKPTKSANNSSCLTSTTTYNTSFSWDPTGATSTTFSPLPPPPPPPLASSDRPKDTAAGAATRRRRRKKKPVAAAAAAGDVDEDGRVARESVAVVKETLEPYVAFKDSMMQMIVEKEIYGWDDLNDLLHRFISLNSPRHHHVILTAFADLWNGVFSPPSPLASAAPAAAPEEDYSYIPATTTSPPTYHSYYY